MLGQHVACPRCANQLYDNGQFSGQVVMCPHCGQQLQMPLTERAPPIASVLKPQRNRYSKPRKKSSNDLIVPMLCGAIVLVLISAIIWVNSTAESPVIASQKKARIANRQDVPATADTKEPSLNVDKADPRTLPLPANATDASAEKETLPPAKTENGIGQVDIIQPVETAFKSIYAEGGKVEVIRSNCTPEFWQKHQDAFRLGYRRFPINLEAYEIRSYELNSPDRASVRVFAKYETNRLSRQGLFTYGVVKRGSQWLIDYSDFFEN